MTEQILVFVKPHAVKDAKAFEILGRIESYFPIVGVKIMEATNLLVRAHYSEHQDKPFFLDLIDQLVGQLVVAAVFEGPEGMIKMIREDLVGATNPAEAKQGTIRHDFGEGTPDNAIHASDSPESARREISFWFGSDRLVPYRPRVIDHVI
ncbi:MAG TPA: nucleoside-diphosphate kinase [Patescibacteria group bacterium]|nr:nucleoside-diphosphate kinase [Patescibacteria group bacterium]